MEVITIRYPPQLRALIEETIKYLETEEIRRITRTEVLNNATALFHAMLFGGYMQTGLHKPAVPVDEGIKKIYIENLIKLKGLGG